MKTTLLQTTGLSGQNSSLFVKQLGVFLVPTSLDGMSIVDVL